MDLKILFFCTFIMSAVITSFCMESLVTKISHTKSLYPKGKFYSKNKKDALRDMETTTTNGSLEMLTIKKDTTNSCRSSVLSFGTTDSMQEGTTEHDTTTPIANIEVVTTNKPRDISCVCGIFLGSQFTKGSLEPAKGEPVISNTLERTFPCTPVGRKQCLTKCLQQIVQHLANSANILCASLDRDIYKEKAFLLIRNCSNKWHNTYLSAGREYCCRNGLPYKCNKK